MGLSTYHQKRHFNRTPEPKGVAGKKRISNLRFVIQKHDASRLHYDFRLELDGVLKSWAVPKGPSLDPGKKSLAVQVEDHPIDYGNFEGVIPQGEYGGGTVLLWDKGIWEPLHDPHEGLAAGKLHFALHGHKLNGEWTLVQMHGRAGDDGKNWLLFKLKDKYASSKGDILKDEPQSVKTRRSIEKIADDRNDVWASDAKKMANLSGGIKSALLAHFTPQLAILSTKPPEGDQWLHEIKFDGYRIIAQVKAGKVKLITRNGNDWTSKFSVIASRLEKLKVDSALLDGEVVALDEKGHSDFQALQAMLKDKEKVRLRYYVFDLPFCNGVDLRATPLIERKKQLETILAKSRLSSEIGYSDHFIGDGDAVEKKACQMDLEGIISKRVDAPYVSRRDPTWLKSKCNQRQEFIIVGYSDPQGSRQGFGSLLLGYHDDKKRLVYAGRVGTGFGDKILRDLHKHLEQLRVRQSSLDIDPPARERLHAHWVKPTLIGEVRFTGWTRDGRLRHPVFIELRTDKPASQIVRERPIDPKEVMPQSKTPMPKKSKSSASNNSNSNNKPIAGVELSHPDKVLYADQGVTKHDIAAYYEQARRWMLPHAINRPLALVRCPGGTSSKCFFQRNWSETLPNDVHKVNVSLKKTPEMHVTVDDLAGVISLVQIGVLEIHTWNCHNDDIHHPDQLIFDLDPGPDIKWKQVSEAARTVHRKLTALRLPTFLKTSGGKGMHITIPIQPTIDWEAGKSFCQTIVESLGNESDLFVGNMRKDLRGGKIYLDYHRNGRSATAVAPYSTRARDGAPVSMPISWEELGKLSSAAYFTVEMAARYLEKRKEDPWRDFEKSRVDLHKVVARASAA
ncbi:MAG TPA: DNA ligase D [Tepidisphaeraceae bacterium]|nr:DNA ligase D [Tepidisphaeraceae bacterium]